MEQLTVVHTANVQIQAFEKTADKNESLGVHRWQKYVDGNGTLWIVVCIFGHKLSGPGATIQLLSVDTETTIDISRTEFSTWVQERRLTRVLQPVIL